MRTATVCRKTLETNISVSVGLDGSGKASIATGIGFFDHMLNQIARHGLFDLDIRCDGDLHIDSHHTVEDVSIALGQAFAQALGDRAGITRYGLAYVPMDETLSRVALDISGRPFLVWQAKFTQPSLGKLDTELIPHAFHSFAQHAGITLHAATLYGHNNHHIAESLFKGLARALRQAVTIDPALHGHVPSTKGTLV